MSASSAGTAELHVALASVARAIAESLEITEVWDLVAAACRKIAPFDAMGIVRLQGDQVRALGAAGDEQFRVLLHRHYPRAGFSPKLWPEADRFVALVHDAAAELDRSYENDRRLVAAGYRSVLRVPLTTGTRRLGSVMIMSREPNLYAEHHAQALLVVAELVTAVLAHQELATKLAEEAGRTAAAHERAALLEQRVHTLADELEALSPHRALGTSRRWREVLTQATKVAATETTVLLTGESGTGKEVVARFIHRGSPRRTGPFVALNCAALPEQLLESELFGHERGAFTGAQGHPGKIAQAAGGVLFLDEVAEMSPSFQAKFLRVLQEREYQRLGSVRTLKADVRVLAATNRDLKAAIGRGTFREDLYYRLAVFDIQLPPLRDRTDDIQLLVDAFLESAARSVGRPAAGISEEARRRLREYSWPGNVRELRNVIERAVILCEGGMISKEHLPLSVAAATEPAAAAAAPRPATLSGMTVDAAERELIVDALARSGNNKSKAARLLGLTRAQLRSRIEKHGLVVADADG
jgi:transcriptional regulator with GAF, ATPase, and Fis domain